MEYVRNTVLKHYHLYHYLLTDQQVVSKSQAQLTVHSSLDVQALETGMKLDEWLMQEQMRELQQNEDVNKKAFQVEQQMLLKKAHANVQSLYQGCVDKLKDSGADHKLTISELVEGESESVLAKIRHRVAEEEMDFDFHVKKLQILSSHTRNEPKVSSPRNSSETLPKKK